jgi:hypothetical protein
VVTLSRLSLRAFLVCRDSRLLAGSGHGRVPVHLPVQVVVGQVVTARRPRAAPTTRSCAVSKGCLADRSRPSPGCPPSGADDAIGRSGLGSPIAALPLVPRRTADGSQHDDRADGNEPGQQAEEDADCSVEPAIGDDCRREIDRGEQFEADPEERRENGRGDEAAPWHLPGQQEVHCPPEESRRASVQDQSVGHGSARVVSRPTDNALGDENPEQDGGPGEEA